MTLRAPVMILLAALVAAAGTPPPAVAQGPGHLAAACATSVPSATSACTEGAVAARALLGHMGLLAGLGSEVPGSASTLGRRLGRSPRIALSFRGGGAHLALPDVTHRGEDPSPETTFFVPTLQGSVGVGLFDGFSPAPTVGGFLSLDLVGQASIVFLPVNQGFAEGVGSFSLGARVGILRESFTLPGVSVSVSRRMIGAARFGAAASGDPEEVELDPTVTSLRATVGKDLFAVGLLAGFGWDDYSADVVLRVADAGGRVVETTGALDASRTLFFLGASLNFLVLQLSAEGGWAKGFGPVLGYAGAPFDPTGGTIFGSISFRLTI